MVSIANEIFFIKIPFFQDNLKSNKSRHMQKGIGLIDLLLFKFELKWVIKIMERYSFTSKIEVISIVITLNIGGCFQGHYVCLDISRAHPDFVKF